MEQKTCVHYDCPFKGKPQPVSQFGKDRNRPDGLHPYCRTCRARIAKNRMQSSEKVRQAAREATARYHKTEHGKKKGQEYYIAHKAEYREREKRYQQRPDVKAKKARKAAVYRMNNPLKHEARQAVEYAIRKGRIKIPDRCEWCGKPANGKLEAHHWKGYAVFRWFDVKFVHKKCHVECEYASPDKFLPKP